MKLPKSKSLPPVRVEPRLYEALVAQAAKEQRSVSSVMRTILREALRSQGKL